MRVSLHAFLFIALLLPALLQPAGNAHAQSPQEVRKAIEKRQDQAEQRQDRIDSLEHKQQDLQRHLAKVEARVKKLRQTIALQEEDLVNIEASEAEARVAYRKLQAWRDMLTDELRSFITALWPIHGQGVAGKLRGTSQWKDMDRRITWLATLYRAAEERLREALNASRLMAENLEQQSKLAREAQEKLAQINQSKDALLRQRLSILASLRKTKNELGSLEKELRSILTVIQELNYKLKTQRTKRFADNKKLLPWPAQGNVASSFSPWAKPPRRGIGLRTVEGAQVKSVFWGKVVHADTVRGFGRVVIVYHGNDYYSVYAYLSSASVTPGQEVEKDEPLGTAGFDPRTKAPGLYFELRLGSKPINPMKWLFPK